MDPVSTVALPLADHDIINTTLLQLTRHSPLVHALRVCFKRCAVVTVTDRGPYIHGRSLDLSKGAADAIGLTASGVGQVKVTRLN
jgi:hypothetical protein